MNPETEQQILDTLREIRDGQRELITLMSARNSAAQELARKSRETAAESVELQRAAMKRFRAVGFIAVPAILVCIVAIVYLLLRYF